VEGTDAAAAHRVEAEERGGGIEAAVAAVEGGREDGEVAARGAVAAVEGGAGVEGDAALRVQAGGRRWAAASGLKGRGERMGQAHGGGGHGGGKSG